MNQASRSHLVIIPSYNPGPKVYETVKAARRYWNPVWIVVDGSSDGTWEGLLKLSVEDSGLVVLGMPANRGKGAAVLRGLLTARRKGYTHALVMDSDGQHPADRIPEFMERSLQEPDAMILGVPVFDASAPALRVKGRRISNWWANLETLWAGIGDSLFGFRVYPIQALCVVMQDRQWMRRFDFDPEAAVRLCWAGIRPVNLPVPVYYPKPEEGGTSHFHYWRDNVLLTWMHIRLMFGFLARLPMLVSRTHRQPEG